MKQQSSSGGRGHRPKALLTLGVIVAIITLVIVFRHGH
jgi:hypothetical protein